MSYGWIGMRSGRYQLSTRAAIKDIKELKKLYSFDAIAFTGSSGACVAFPAAVSTKIPVIYVRKDGEKSHGDKVEFMHSADGKEIKSYLIVDDFIASGETVRNICNAITSYKYADLNCVGVYLWNCTRGDATISFSKMKQHGKRALVTKCLNIHYSSFKG